MMRTGLFSLLTIRRPAPAFEEVGFQESRLNFTQAGATLAFDQAIETPSEMFMDACHNHDEQRKLALKDAIDAVKADQALLKTILDAQRKVTP